MALPATVATPASLEKSAEPVDTVSLTGNRSFTDADGNLIVRQGDSSRLGRLVDSSAAGTGPADCQVVHQNQTPEGQRGYAVFKGKDIRTDHLTIPLANITGIEAPELSKPGAENYFADAWKDGREKAAEDQGTSADKLPRDAFAMAVNSQDARSQDRLHIHTDRLDPQLGQQLKQQVDDGAVASDHWTDVKPVHGHQYRALWVDGTDLTQNPFQLVHDQVVADNGGGKAGEAAAGKQMGMHSLAVVGETDAQGRPGFIILDGRFGKDAKMPDGPHDSGSAEEWLAGHADAPP